MTAQDFASGDTGSIRAVSVIIDSPAALASYSSTVLGDGPVVYWRLGDTAPSTVLTDSSPNLNNGTYLNGVTLGAAGAIAGDLDTAASFDGVNDSGRVPDANSLDVGDTFTAEGWVKRSSTSKSIELMNKGGNGLQVTVMGAGSGNQVWLRKANVTTIARSADPVPADGAFHHIVVTKSGINSAKIYVDGHESAVAVSGVQVVANTAFPLTFGSAASTQTTFDEFALYGRALTPAEVTEHYSAGHP